MGQRLSKEIYDENDAWVETTYYIRDAQGNVMSTYLHKSAGESETFDLTERHIYPSAPLGASFSSRLGLYKEPVSMLAVGGPPAFQYDIPGYRHYELSNHTSTALSAGLGNVTTIITGQKLPILSGSTLTGYKPQIVQSMDYSPFGVTRLSFDVTAMSTTHPVGDGYRYGFNGMEKDDEVKGAGNSLDFGARVYDSRLGRWLSLDALAEKYPDMSPYNFVAGNPLIFVDPDGKQNVDPKTGEKVVKVNGQWQTESGGKVSKMFVKRSQPLLDKLTSTEVGTKLFNELQGLRTKVVMAEAKKKKGPNSKITPLKKGDDFKIGDDGLYDEVAINVNMDGIGKCAEVDGVDPMEKLLQTISVEKGHISSDSQISKEQGYGPQMYDSENKAMFKDVYESLLQEAVRVGIDYRGEKGIKPSTTLLKPIENVNKDRGTNIQYPNLDEK